MEKQDVEKLASVDLNDDLRDHTRDLPPPVTTHHQQQARARPKLSATAIIPVWIVLSSGVIIYNNYIYNTLNFKFPVFLVTWHLTFAVSIPYRPSSFISSSHFFFATAYMLAGNRNSCSPTHYQPPRRREGCPSQQRHVLPFHPPHWPSFFRQSYPQQHSLSVPKCGVYSDVEGELIHLHRVALSLFNVLQLLYWYPIRHPLSSLLSRFRTSYHSLISSSLPSPFIPEPSPSPGPIVPFHNQLCYPLSQTSPHTDLYLFLRRPLPL